MGRNAPQPDPMLAFQIEDGIIKMPRHYGLIYFKEKFIINANRPDLSINFTGKLFNHQIDVITEGITFIRNEGGVIYALRTGFGKTVVSAYTSCLLGGMVMVLCESTIVLDQWKNTYKQFTDAKVWVVGEDPPPVAHVVICMTTRIDKLPIDYRKVFNTVIVDEAHCFGTQPRINCLLQFEPKYVILATATPKRDDGLFAAVSTFSGDNKVIRIWEDDFKVIKYNTGIQVPIEINKNGKPDWSKLTRKLCEEPDRNDLILQIVRDNVAKGFKVLILTWLSDHVKFLHQQISLEGISCEFLTGSKTKYIDSRVLVGTIAKIGKAFDEKMACTTEVKGRLDLLLLVGSIKSRNALEQGVGRVFRAASPNVIHFVDDNKISKRHWTSPRPWYKSRKGEITEASSPLVGKKKVKTISSEDMALKQLQRWKGQVGSLPSGISPSPESLVSEQPNYGSGVVQAKPLVSRSARMSSLGQITTGHILGYKPPVSSSVSVCSGQISQITLAPLDP